MFDCKIVDFGPPQNSILFCWISAVSKNGVGDFGFSFCSANVGANFVTQIYTRVDFSGLGVTKVSQFLAGGSQGPPRAHGLVKKNW